MYNASIYNYLKGKNLKKEISVGDVVFVIPDGNKMRGKKSNQLDYVKKITVEKVGTKYFYLKGMFEKFGEDNGRLRDITNYGGEYIIFLNEKDMKINILTQQLIDKSFGITTLISRASIEDKLILKELFDKYN